MVLTTLFITGLGGNLFHTPAAYDVEKLVPEDSQLLLASRAGAHRRVHTHRVVATKSYPSPDLPQFDPIVHADAHLAGLGTAAATPVSPDADVVVAPFHIESLG